MSHVLSSENQTNTSQVFELDHPVVTHHLSQLRDVKTPPSEFREIVKRLTTFLAYQATEDLTLAEKTVETPIQEMVGGELCEQIGLVPILRAGLGMVDPMLNILPFAQVWHLGLYRDEETAKPVEYYSKLPPGQATDVAIVLDPMLATGGSALAAMSTLRSWGVKRLKLLSLIAAPEGIEAVTSESPDVQVYVAVVDERLNDQKFIVPGLGDAGDRIFNT